MSPLQDRLTPYAQLAPEEQKVVELAWEMSKRAYCPYSDFPVGAGILAENETGEQRFFGGCNVENASYGGSICAERTAAVKAVSEGFRTFRCIAVICAKVPGGSPCGICRQFLREFGGLTATVLNIQDRDNSVVRYRLEEILPDSFGPESL